MKRRFLLLFSVAVLMMFSNCASIISGGSRRITVQSEPVGAGITITDKNGVAVYKGVTPAVVELKTGAGFFKRASYLIKFSQEGYQERITPITCVLNDWYIGNCVFGGVIGLLIVDPATGAMWKFDQEVYSQRLQPSSSFNFEKNPVKICDIKDIPQDLKSHLVKIN